MAVHSQPLRLLVPHIFVWPPLLLPSSSSARVCPTQSFTQQLCHAESFTQQLCHTQSFTQQRCHTHNLSRQSFTHNFVTHHLSHTTLSHTIFHTTTLSRTIFTQQLCHTHKIFHTTTLQHTRTLSFKTIFHTHTQLCHTPSFKPLRFARRACHLYDIGLALVARLAVSRPSRRGTLCGRRGRRGRRGTCSHPPAFFRGRRGTWRHQPSFCAGWLWWRAWSPLFARGAAALCVAGAALGDINLRFAWQDGTGLALVARLGPVIRPRRRGTLRGRRGTWRHRPSLCVAVVALAHIHLRFAWQAWPLWHWVGSGGALRRR